MDKQLKQQHRSAKSILVFQKAERQKDAKALAELVYDIFKEKKQREKSIMIDGQNSAKQSTRNQIY